MKPFRLMQAVGFVSLAAGGLTGCLSAPSYPNTPSIAFESIRRERFTPTPGALPIDSIYVTISFQDGDGDLGLTADEAKTTPYSNKYYGANFFATSFVKRATTNVYDSLKTVRPDLNLSKAYQYERFGHVSTTTDSRKAPLKGTLTRSYGFIYGSPFLPTQEIKFRISIYDRALNQSNEIETESIVIPTK
ncbi:MAG: hypothetical protein EOO37_05875 [Cytophagaceae bacterium]|nr:MAG: hypothetical protein EOO37_05875 [Cytophagaceae bacterium]